jgi:hypothetical protein
MFFTATSHQIQVVGHGVRLGVAAGASVGWVDEGPTLIAGLPVAGELTNGLVHVEPGRQAQLRPDEEGRTGGLTVLGDAEPSGSWHIECGGVRAPWPAGSTLAALDIPGGPWSFELAEKRTMLILRGPLERQQVPAPYEAIGPGQTVVADDLTATAPWLELRYQVDQETWLQRHYYAAPTPEAVVLVTVQRPADEPTPLYDQAASIAASIELVS